MKKAATALAATLAFSVLPAGIANAHDVRGHRGDRPRCGDQWHAVKTRGNRVLQKADWNDNGWVCFRVNPNGAIRVRDDREARDWRNHDHGGDRHHGHRHHRGR